FPRQSFTAVNAFWTARAQERVVTLAVTSKARAYVAAHHLPTRLRGRLLKVGLASGGGGVLRTGLRDGQLYPAAEFKEVDGWRWHHEICQSQPVKMARRPLRLGIATIIYLRGVVKREEISDVDLFAGDDDFFDQTLSHGLAIGKGERSEVFP